MGHPDVSHTSIHIRIYTKQNADICMCKVNAGDSAQNEGGE